MVERVREIQKSHRSQYASWKLQCEEEDSHLWGDFIEDQDASCSRRWQLAAILLQEQIEDVFLCLTDREQIIDLCALV